MGDQVKILKSFVIYIYHGVQIYILYTGTMTYRAPNNYICCDRKKPKKTDDYYF